MPYAPLPAGPIFYARYGSDGPPMILIHGAGGSHLVWPPEVRRLSGAIVYAIDLPGHGKSSGRGQTSAAAYAEDIRAFMDAVGVDTAVLVGHSMGGAIAQIRSDPGAVFALVTDWAHGSLADERMRAQSIRVMRNVDPDIIYGDFLACNTFDIMDRLGQIAVPTLVISGTEDRMTPLKYSDKLAVDIPGASLVIVEGAGHMVMLEKPQAVSDALSAFIRECIV
jgi:pimeloyl-ACP methyl ester carboxylesterase